MAHPVVLLVERPTRGKPQADQGTNALTLQQPKFLNNG